MLSCSALLSLDSSQDIVSESQISSSASLPRVTIALPRSPPRLEPLPQPSPRPDESSDSQLPSPSEESQTARKLILRKRATSPLQVKLPFMPDRLRVRRGKSASPQNSPTPETATALSSPTEGKSDALRTSSPRDSELTTTLEPEACTPNDHQCTPCDAEDPNTTRGMLPVRRVRFVTPPSSPEELTTASSPHESESASEDEPIYSTTVSPIGELPLATFPVPQALPWPRLLDDQSAGGLAVATLQPSVGNALGLSLGLPYADYATAPYPGLYVLPAMDTWEEICENLACALEVCAVLADVDRSSPGSMSALYCEPEPCPAMEFVYGSGGLWNCRVFPSMLF